MVKIEVDGEIYIINNYDIMDSTYIIPNEHTCSQVAKVYCDNLDIANLTKDTLKYLIQFTKKNKAYLRSLEIALQYYQKYRLDVDDVIYILPVLTSLYRQLKQPQKAIDLCEDAKANHGNKVFSAALLTSLAAAYCDNEDYQMAKKICAAAYARQGGSLGYTTEISLVYKRITKAMGDME